MPPAYFVGGMTMTAFESEQELHTVIEKLESSLPQQSIAQEAVQEQEDEHGI